MKLLSTLVTLVAASDAVLASTWFTKAGTYTAGRAPNEGCQLSSCAKPQFTDVHGISVAYNKWHETELERWLSDHDIPYPTPADRRDLEKLVKENWDSYIVSPYSKWDTAALNEYLQKKGIETKKGAEASTDSLVSQVKTNWYETEDKAQSAWGSVTDWILDTWTDSQLKAFCDKNGIPGKLLPSRILLGNPARLPAA